MKVIFKVAQSSDQKLPPRQTSINTARDKPTSVDDAADTMDYKDVVRPIEDVRSFHTGLDQITKGRYDRYHYCITIVLLHNMLMKAHITNLYHV